MFIHCFESTTESNPELNQYETLRMSLYNQQQ